VDRYNRLKNPILVRRQRLEESLDVQKLFRDVEDEEVWIRENEPIVASSNRGRDLTAVHNMIKKHQVKMTFNELFYSILS